MGNSFHQWMFFVPSEGTGTGQSAADFSSILRTTKWRLCLAGGNPMKSLSKKHPCDSMCALGQVTYAKSGKNGINMDVYDCL